MIYQKPLPIYLDKSYAIRNTSLIKFQVLSMCEVLKYLIDESGLLIAPDTLEEVHRMDHYTWQKFVDRIKGTKYLQKNKIT